MKKLVRSKDKVFCGVCGGVAEYFGWNVRDLRLAWVILSIIGVGSMVVFYILLSLLMPDGATAKKSYEERMNERLKNGI